MATYELETIGRSDLQGAYKALVDGLQVHEQKAAEDRADLKAEITDLKAEITDLKAEGARLARMLAEAKSLAHELDQIARDLGADRGLVASAAGSRAHPHGGVYGSRISTAARASAVAQHLNDQEPGYTQPDGNFVRVFEEDLQDGLLVRPQWSYRAIGHWVFAVDRGEVIGRL